jgi:hypothetical protein
LRDGRRHRGHNGGDPGIRTSTSFRPSDGVGAIAFVNRVDVDLSEIKRRLFQEAARIRAARFGREVTLDRIETPHRPMARPGDPDQITPWPR